MFLVGAEAREGLLRFADVGVSARRELEEAPVAADRLGAVPPADRLGEEEVSVEEPSRAVIGGIGEGDRLLELRPRGGHVAVAREQLAEPVMPLRDRWVARDRLAPRLLRFGPAL